MRIMSRPRENFACAFDIYLKDSNAYTNTYSDSKLYGKPDSYTCDHGREPTA